MATKLKAQVHVDYQWCKRCGICIALCPRQVFTTGQDGEPIVSRQEACTACLVCELQCPDFAIQIEES